MKSKDVVITKWQQKQEDIRQTELRCLERVVRWNYPNGTWSDNKLWYGDLSLTPIPQYPGWFNVDGYEEWGIVGSEETIGHFLTKKDDIDRKREKRKNRDKFLMGLFLLAVSAIILTIQFL